MSAKHLDQPLHFFLIQLEHVSLGASPLRLLEDGLTKRECAAISNNSELNLSLGDYAE